MVFGHDPFREMRRLNREMDRLMSAGLSGAAVGFPAMNVHANADGVAITAEVPGVGRDALDISVHRDTVTVKGERTGEVDGAEGYHRRERGAGRFSRTVTLPFPVDPEHVEANLADGVLQLSLRRPESDKPRRIEVKAA